MSFRSWIFNKKFCDIFFVYTRVRSIGYANLQVQKPFDLFLFGMRGIGIRAVRFKGPDGKKIIDVDTCVRTFLNPNSNYVKNAFFCFVGTGHVTISWTTINE